MKATFGIHHSWKIGDATPSRTGRATDWKLPVRWRSRDLSTLTRCARKAHSADVQNRRRKYEPTLPAGSRRIRIGRRFDSAVLLLTVKVIQHESARLGWMGGCVVYQLRFARWRVFAVRRTTVFGVVLCFASCCSCGGGADPALCLCACERVR